MEVFYEQQKEPRPGGTGSSGKNHRASAESNISSMEDIRNLFKETIAEFMENGSDSEMHEKLGYSKYDYKKNVMKTAGMGDAEE